MEEREMSTFLFLDELIGLQKEERRWRGREMYKYPPAPNGHFSRDSATAQVR